MPDTLTSPRRRHGATLLELLVVLAVLAVTIGLAVGPTHRALDSMAVRAAADALTAQLHRARAVAASRGAADVVLDSVTCRAWIEDAAGRMVGDPVSLRDDYGVRLAAGGAESRISFNGLGLGRFASRTVRLVRGHATARITVSTYGAVRRW